MTTTQRKLGSKAMASVISIFCLAVAGCTTLTGELEHSAPQGWVPSVPVSITQVAVNDLPEVCGLEPGRLVGCSVLYRDRCEIYIGRGLGLKLVKEVRAHELAHCAGWKHD